MMNNDLEQKQTKTNPAESRPARRRTALRAMACIGALVLAMAVSVAGYLHYRMNYCITTVVPGRLYRSSKMTPERLAGKAAELGIRTVIDLRNPAHHRRPEDRTEAENKVTQEEAALKAGGIRHIELRSRQIPLPRTVDKFIEAVDSAGASPVLIHCDHGIGRTGLFVALYLMEYAGYSNEDARHCVSRYYSLRLHGRKHFAPDYDKGKYIMKYAIRHKPQPANAASPATAEPAGVVAPGQTTHNSKGEE